MAKAICWIQHTQKRIEVEKNGDKDGKALHKLMNSAAYGKAMEALRSRIDVKFVSNKISYLKWIFGPTIGYRIFESDSSFRGEWGAAGGV